LTEAIIDAIIRNEEVDVALRLENFSFLKFLLKQ